MIFLNENFVAKFLEISFDIFLGNKVPWLSNNIFIIFFLIFNFLIVCVYGKKMPNLPNYYNINF